MYEHFLINTRYYNTVGSKEGWTPATFVSSRANRKKDEPKAVPVQQRPEDFMDEEDIADAEDQRRVETADGFAGLGSTENDATRQGAYIDLINLSISGGENAGVRLLKKMGWREGQGVGPKVRRGARINDHNDEERSEETHLFPPENTRMIGFVRKNDHKGLGFDSETKSSAQAPTPDVKSDGEEDDKDRAFMAPKVTKKKKPIRGGIGIGILNDTGSSTLR